MSEIEVVGLGALNIDHLYRVERILDDGEAVVEEAKSLPGGSAANTIYGLARLGVSTGFSGALGDDEDGSILIQDFQQASVDTSRIRTEPGAKTGSVLCLTDSMGRRSLYVVPGANSQLTKDDLDFTHINQARWLHLSSFANEQQFNISLEIMDRLDPALGLSFSPGALYATKGIKALTPILARTRVLFINRAEIEALTAQDFRAGAELCLKRGCHLVVVTLGKGTKLKMGGKVINAAAYIKDSKNEHAIESRSQDEPSEVDTTGAGDAFAVGFLYGLLKGKEPEQCGRLGDIVAQFSIRKIGARAGLPTFNELAQRYYELYKQSL